MLGRIELLILRGRVIVRVVKDRHGTGVLHAQLNASVHTETKEGGGQGQDMSP
jgi:hypothetical protein